MRQGATEEVALVGGEDDERDRFGVGRKDRARGVAGAGSLAVVKDR